MKEIIRLAKKIKALLKKIIKRNKKAYISPVRRIDSVKTDRRIVAMTFDDGPCALPSNPDVADGKPLTEIILDTLDKFGAKASFDVVGDTGANYPDEAGKQGTAAWGGIRFDHYPDFEKDACGGAANQRRLLAAIARRGHEITNHGYLHRIFGPQPFIYGKRESFKNIFEVVKDLGALHELVREECGQEIALARPAHYVDRINDALTSYDAYTLAGYQYMGASFDGAGWLPRGTYQEEIRDMVKPLSDALAADPGSLCGRIIFQKDGFNMSRRTPVAEGLEKQLELLYNNGYQVVTVSELLKTSFCSDLSESDSVYGEVKELLEAGFSLLFNDNTFRADKPVTRGEFAAFIAPRPSFDKRVLNLAKGKRGKLFGDVPYASPYSEAIKSAVDNGYMETENGKFYPDAELSGPEATDALKARFGIEHQMPIVPSRRDVVHGLHRAWKKSR